MSNKKRVNQVRPEEVPILDVPIIDIGELEQPKSVVLETAWSPGESLPRYVVVRGGLRVSDKDYPKPDEPRAIAEKEFWQKVVNKWPDGTRVETFSMTKRNIGFGNMSNNLVEDLKPINDIPESDMVSRMAAASELAENPEVVKEVLKYGKVPVVYGPTRAMLRKPQEPGLRTLIENAMTVKEVNNLLNKGKVDYKNASSKTIKKWETAANKRISELTPK